MTSTSSIEEAPFLSRLMERMHAQKVIFAETVLLAVDSIMPKMLVLLGLLLVCEAADFVTGVARSLIVSWRFGKRFSFESAKMWRTIIKTVAFVILVTLFNILEYLYGGTLDAARKCVFFFCFTETWSVLENLAVSFPKIPVFRLLLNVMSERARRDAGIDIASVMRTESTRNSLDSLDPTSELHQADGRTLDD